MSDGFYQDPSVDEVHDDRYHFCEICKGLANHKTSRHPWPSREEATDGSSPPTTPDAFRELLMGGNLMYEDEYLRFDKAVRDSGPIYDPEPIYRIVAEVINKRIQELY